MQFQTIADLKRAVSQKLKITKNGFEASVKADTPDAAVALAAQVYTRYADRKGTEPTPVDRPRSEYPALLLSENGEYILKHGSGESAPWDPAVQALIEEYRVKIELVLNTKGLGFEVSVKGGNVNEMFAIQEYTEARLNAVLFPPTTEAKGA